MRDIIFRGKAVGVGVWFFGSYVQTTEALTDRLVSLICPDGGNMSPGGNFPAAEVAPSTVGQFTGLTDTDGARIFEGDIVSFSAEEYFKSDGRLAAVDRHGEIVFCEGAFMILSKNSYFALSKSAVKAYDLIVCGNVHDNPDMMGGGAAKYGG